MSDIASPVPDGYSPSPGKPQKGWFGRNWWWFLTLIIGGPLLCCCGGPGILYFVFQDKVLKITQTYQQPLSMAQNNDQAIELIGEPMVGGTPTKSERSANGKKYLILTFSVTGPNGSGVITAESEVAMTETLIKAELVIDDSGEVIDLIGDSSNSPPPNPEISPDEPLGGGIPENAPIPQDPANATVWVGTKGSAYAETTEALPILVSANQAHNIELDRSTDPWTALSGYEQNIERGAGSRRTQMREVYVPEGFRLVRLRVDWDSARTLYGQTAASVTPLRLRDDAGSVHEMIGYCLVHTEASTLDLWLRQTNGRPVTSNQLPIVRSGEEMYLYFQVPEGNTITGFMAGNSVEDSGEFLTPLEVEAD